MKWNPVSKIPEPYRPFLVKRDDGLLYIEEFDPDSKFPKDAVGWVYVAEGEEETKGIKMSKTLTEQYYDLELEEGFYYAKSERGDIFILEVNPCREWLYERCEILGKVPEYNRYELLLKKAERADYLDEKLKTYSPEELLIVKNLQKKLDMALEFIDTAKRFPECFRAEECEDIILKIEEVK